MSEPASTTRYCPACGRVLYDRCLASCGFCGNAIPESLRFKPAEIVKIRADYDESLVRRHRELVSEREAAEREAQALATEILVLDVAANLSAPD